MFKSLTLLLPALIPSWRFFDVIAPSPRIEFALFKTPKGTSGVWQEFRSRPAHVSVRRMLGHMLWNPARNETLFLVSCAENLMEKGSEHYYQEILSRILTDIKSSPASSPAAPYVQFRLAFISRGGAQLEKEIMFESRFHKIAEV